MSKSEKIALVVMLVIAALGFLAVVRRAYRENREREAEPIVQRIPRDYDDSQEWQ